MTEYSGYVRQVIGPTVDFEFPADHLPSILNAVEIDDKERAIKEAQMKVEHEKELIAAKEQARIEGERRAKEEQERKEQEARRLADKAEADRKAEAERLAKEARYQKFLVDNGYNQSDFFVDDRGSSVVLYKKVATFTK